MCIFLTIDGPASANKFIQDMETFICDSSKIYLDFRSFDSDTYEKVISHIPDRVRRMTISFEEPVPKTTMKLRIPSQVTHLLVATLAIFDIPATVEGLFLFDPNSDGQIYEDLDVYPSTVVYTKKCSISYVDKSGCKRLSKIYDLTKSENFATRFSFCSYIKFWIEDPSTSKPSSEYIIDDDFITRLRNESDEKCRAIAKDLAMKIREMLIADSKDGILNKTRVYEIESSEYNDIDIIPFLQRHISTKHLALSVVENKLCVVMQ